MRARLYSGSRLVAAVELSRTPKTIQLGNTRLFDRVDDPDTGEFLGGYVERLMFDD